MPWFPIIADQVAEIERQLGLELPRGYKAIVGDPRYRVLLAHPSIGAIDLDTSMTEFLAHTELRRATLPGFPARAVVAMEGAGRYIRFWLPDPKRPGTLGETVYAWDVLEGKQTKDASSAAILKSMIGLVANDASASRPVRPEAPGFVAQAVESSTRAESPGAWLPSGDWELRGSYVTATDAAELPERGSPATVRLKAGAYRVEIRVVASPVDGTPVIGAWRLLAADTAADATLIAQHIADVDVDLGAVAIYDRQEFFARVRSDAREDFASGLMELGLPLAKLEVGSSAPVWIARSGDGDGSYPFLALRAGGEIVGAEIRFFNLD